MMGEFMNVAEIFGENVFNDTVMQERLPKKGMPLQFQKQRYSE